MSLGMTVLVSKYPKYDVTGNLSLNILLSSFPALPIANIGSLIDEDLSKNRIRTIIDKIIFDYLIAKNVFQCASQKWQLN